MKLRFERNEKHKERDWAKLNAGSAVWEDQDLPDVQRGIRERLRTLLAPPLLKQGLMKPKGSRDERKKERKKR